ncbi:TetR/AcrR family transcriptional regulator [Phytohabitans aurantiacus]|uniref:TetR family transcriptional regulator n=1 Tax=Phytohabitans aurantiacus TaxID=3016789 RepID=A0ABQ5QNV6_9ACTN|nr:TetR/AcrR family transcriptional regulator [Phytohabitans aurantiacus]GLH95429.1 TetR family transcriptional regulator [Phytohabitans aurantiacus]
MSSEPEATVRHTPTGQRAERKRHAIVDAARDIFIRHGYEVGVDTIAAEAGVSKVTIYNHFGSKEALFIAVIVDALDEALDVTLTESKKHLVDSADPRAALLGTAAALVDGVTQPSVLALRNLVTGELRRFPELGAAWRERGPQRIAAAMRPVLRAMVKRGELRIPDMELALQQFFGLTLYPHFAVSSYGGAIEPRLARRLISQGVDMFLSYYRSAGSLSEE